LSTHPDKNRAQSQNVRYRRKDVIEHTGAQYQSRIDNDWLKEFCSHYPDRQIGLACLPFGSIDRAVDEVHRVREDGARRPRTVVLVGHGADVAP
jgi:hypothetical protein